MSARASSGDPGTFSIGGPPRCPVPVTDLAAVEPTGVAQKIEGRKGGVRCVLGCFAC